MWLHLLVQDSNATMIYESGAYDEITAELTKDTAIKIYETTQGIWDTNSASCVIESNGQQLFHFVLNNCIAKDNRIPPLGFRGGANLELKPVAYTYPTSTNNTNALVNFDESSYVFPVPNTAVFPLSVTATLKYQTASKDYIDFLDSSSTTVSENELCNRTQTVGPASQSRGAFMQNLWQNNGQSAPVDMDSSSIQVNL